MNWDNEEIEKVNALRYKSCEITFQLKVRFLDLVEQPLKLVR